jgi:hypothetical protein
LGDQIKNNEMNGTFGTYGGRREVYTGFWWGNMRETDHLGDPGVDGRIILKWIFWKLDWRGMNWIDLAEDRDRWLAFVDAVTNLRIP